MLTTNKTNSIVRSILGILLTVVLLTAACPIPAYAAGDNQGVMDAFPALGVSSDTMNENNGTISTLYGGGTIGDNKGTISSSRGTVYANHGSIESLSAGKVGTNYGTINRIENSGLLEINYMDGTVGFVGMGNEVGTNYGTIQDNAGIVYHYYGEISNNYSTVHMHGGWIQNNYKNGTVTFEAYSDDDYISSIGSLEHNEGSVIINSGEFTIDENKGNIVIANAFVEVFDNYGNITLGPNARLICDENMGSGVITKTDKSAVITCNLDTGTIKDETAAWYKIVFEGDDGKAVVKECDKEENGVYYTQSGSIVTFTLPSEYECSAGMIWESGNVNTWVMNADPAEGSTEFTIFCHKCTPGDYRMTKDTHFQICAGCGKTLTETEGTHTFGEFVPNDDATCVKDGTETGKCTVCGYKRTRTAVDSHLTSDHHEHIVIDQRVEPTETSTGLTQGSHCEDCNKVLTAQEIITKIPHTCVSSSGYLYDGSTHWKICSICNEKFNEETHNNGNLVLNTEATCTAAGVKDYYTCSCGKAFEDATCNIEIADLDAWKAEGGNGYIAPKGHTYGEWAITKEPTLTEKGMKERSCTVCGDKKTEEIPVLTPTTYSIISGANGEWTKGSSDGLAFTSDADLAKFVCVMVDGTEIAATNYTAVSGSTKVTLNAAYLETLSVGSYSIDVVSNDGTASTSFTVKAATHADPTDPTNPTDSTNPTDPTNPTDSTNPADPTNPTDPTNLTDPTNPTNPTNPADLTNPTDPTNPTDSTNPADLTNPTDPTNPTNPQTGDNSNMFLWIALLFVSSGVLVGTTVYGRKKKYNAD